MVFGLEASPMSRSPAKARPQDGDCWRVAWDGWALIKDLWVCFIHSQVIFIR